MAFTEQQMKNLATLLGGGGCCFTSSFNPNTVVGDPEAAAASLNYNEFGRSAVAGLTQIIYVNVPT